MTYATTITASIVLRSVLATQAEGLPDLLLSYLSARTWGYLGTVLFTGVFSYFALKKNWGTQTVTTTAPASQPMRSKV
jgi:hypothetical protein